MTILGVPVTWRQVVLTAIAVPLVLAIGRFAILIYWAVFS